MYKVAPRSVNTSESPATIIQANNLTEQQYIRIFYTILIDYTLEKTTNYMFDSQRYL